MSTFVMQHCTIFASGKEIQLLALVPERYVELSSVLDELRDCPFSDALEDEEFLDISRREIRMLRKKFPQLQRATMLFHELTVSFPLEAGDPEAVLEDRVLFPGKDVLFLAHIRGVAALPQ